MCPSNMEQGACYTCGTPNRNKDAVREGTSSTLKKNFQLTGIG
jgi:hypothetical protein